MYNIIKINKKYILIFVIYIFLMLVCLLNEIGVTHFLSMYLFNENFRISVTLMYNNSNFFINIYEYIMSLFENFDWDYDYIIIWSTNIFQISLPFTAICSSILFNEEQNNRFKISFKLSLTIFLSYIVFYLFAIFLCKGQHSNYISRELFLDIFGENFYYDNILLYYFIEGFIKFFLMSFVYSFIGTFLSNNYYKYILFLTIYFIISMISNILYYLIGSIAIYANPTTIMIASTYIDISTIGIILSSLFPLFICLIFYFEHWNIKMKKIIWTL